MNSVLRLLAVYPEAIELVIAGENVLPPCLVVEVPLNRFAETGFVFFGAANQVRVGFWMRRLRSGHLGLDGR